MKSLNRGSVGKEKNIFCFLAVAAFLCFLSVIPVQAKTYYTKNQVKLPLNSSKYRLVSVSEGKVIYQKVTWVQKKDRLDVKLGKKKTARLTSSTKYYLGNEKRYSSQLPRKNYQGDKVKWIYKTTKKDFIRNYSKGSYHDYLVVKNGRVRRIYSKLQAAQ